MAAKPSAIRRRKFTVARSKPMEAKSATRSSPQAASPPADPPAGDPLAVASPDLVTLAVDCLAVAPSIDTAAAGVIATPAAIALEIPAVGAPAVPLAAAALEVREQPKPDAPLIAESISQALSPYLKNFSDVLQVVMRVAEVSSDSYSAQTPHPGHLERLEAVSPGSAKAIIDMAIREQRSRHRNSLLSNLYPYIDQLLGFALAALCFTYGFLLGMAGHDEAGGAMIAISALGAVGWFIMTRLAARKGDRGPSAAGMPAQSGAD